MMDKVLAICFMGLLIAFMGIVLVYIYDFYTELRGSG